VRQPCPQKRKTLVVHWRRRKKGDFLCGTRAEGSTEGEQQIIWIYKGLLGVSEFGKEGFTRGRVDEVVPPVKNWEELALLQRTPTLRRKGR